MLIVRVEDERGESYYANVAKVSFVDGELKFTQLIGSELAVASWSGCSVTVLSATGAVVVEKVVPAKESKQ